METTTTPSYLVRAGTGKNVAVPGATVTLMATRAQSGDLFEIVEVTTQPGFGLPAHQHTTTHKSLYVLTGELQLSFEKQTYTLRAGDFGHLPKGTTHLITTIAPDTRTLYFSQAGGMASLFTEWAQGAPTAQAGEFVLGDGVDFQRVDGFEPAQPAVAVTNMDRPDGTQPYVIGKGGGEHLLVEDQVQTFLARQSNTDGHYLVVLTDGRAGNAIIQHYHKRHAECFYALEGDMTMWNEGQPTPLKPGDFMYVPAETKHAYRLDSPYTRFIGVLSPGLFEPFFDALCTPYAAHTLPEKPGPARFDRVLKNYGNLDLYFVSPPPDHSMNPVQATMVRFSFWLAGKLAGK